MKAISSRDHLKMVERCFGIGTWAYDHASDVFEWSEGFYRLLHLSPSERPLSLSSFLEMAHPDERQALQDRIGHGVNFDNVPVRLTLQDGSVRWLAFQSEITQGTLIIGAAQDVTNVKNANLLFMQRRNLFLSLLNMLEGMVLYISPNGILTFEEGWCSFTGTTAAENSLNGWLNCIHPEDREMTGQAWSSSFENRNIFTVTPRVRRKDGVYQKFLMTGAPIVDEHGEVIEMVGYCKKLLQPPTSGREIIDNTDRPYSPEELRCARALLGWSVDQLAKASGVSVSTIKRLEAGYPSTGNIRQLNQARLRAVLSKAGLAFQTHSDGTRTLRWHPSRNTAELLP